MMNEQDKPTSAEIAIEKEQQRDTARSIHRQVVQLQKYNNLSYAGAANLKCPTCGYQLVALDNEELVKLTEKAAYHELRTQLAAEREKVKDLEQVWNALEENQQLRDQQAAIETRAKVLAVALRTFVNNAGVTYYEEEVADEVKLARTALAKWESSK